MFYTNELTSDGPLSVIWLAAHSVKSLKKKEAIQCSVESACSAILDGNFALRLSAYLMLGIHKVYDKQISYLLHDCSIASDKSIHHKKKVLKNDTAMDIDLTQQDALEVDEDQLMETLSLSAPSIELERGIDMPSQPFDAISLHSGLDHFDESVEVGRRASSIIEEPLQYVLQDDSILPNPEPIATELMNEERAFSETRSIQDSIQDMILEPSLDLAPLTKSTKKKRKRKSTKSADVSRKYFDASIDAVLEPNFDAEFEMFKPTYFKFCKSEQRKAVMDLPLEEPMDLVPDFYPVEPISESSELPLDNIEFHENEDFQEGPAFLTASPDLAHDSIKWAANDSFIGKTKGFTKSQAAFAFVELLGQNFDLIQEEAYCDIVVA